MQARNQLLGMASQHPALMAVPNGLEDEPQYQLTVDDEKARVPSSLGSEQRNQSPGAQLRQRLY
jgi:multidrug efflux pump